MSMNKYMHPRNIYKTPPDYTDLAIKYPEFRKICKLELDGNVSIDMKSENTLKILTKCLLSKDFGLEIDLPDQHLVPTVPLRLNYILWLEDVVVNLLGISERCISGIDIGCGASCVYSLLAAKKNGWRMTALEVKATNAEYARKNVERNDLGNLVSVFLQTDKEVIFKDLFATTGNVRFDFCLCNPPFFSRDSDAEVHKRPDKKEARKQAANLATGTSDEIACEGGEVAFVRRIVEESLIFKDRVRIYTTMLGQKTTFIAVLKTLKDYQITNYTQTEFCQGNTARWGVAWCFDPEIILRTVPYTSGLHQPTTKSFSSTFKTSESFSRCLSHLHKALCEMRLTLETKSEAKDCKCFLAKAYADHWTNVRRKRRMGESSKDFAVESGDGTGRGSEPTASEIPILTFEIDISYDDDDGFALKLVYLDGSCGANGLYQLFQFLKNNLKILEKPI